MFPHEEVQMSLCICLLICWVCKSVTIDIIAHEKHSKVDSSDTALFQEMPNNHVVSAKNALKNKYLENIIKVMTLQ